MTTSSELPDLPIRPLLGDVVSQLADNGSAVLVAPPGTGKTTLVPLALAEAGLRVVVAEPRRLATRAAAARMAELLGQNVGQRVGYSVRGDRKRGKETVVEVVTSGLLVRRLQADPELPGVDVVVLDECHERHLDADLLLALLLDAREGLRPDLKVLATSATVAAEHVSDLLDQAPVLHAEARTHPVRTEHLPPLRAERIEATTTRAIRTALSEQDGDVLVFLPGAGEIRRVSEKLAYLSDVEVVPLHGRLAPDKQDAALRQGARRRVVLATAVAESSLTVPGVRAVVDSGLSRVSRVDTRRGLAGLATVRVSRAVAEQRAGRAGRQGPGVVYRCWPEHEHTTLPAYPEPEIRTAELTRLALELACWGTPDGSALSWWDAPPGGALAAGREVLRGLGALDAADSVTPRGRRMAELGLHPRLARALLDGAELAGSNTAAEVVALLDNDAATSETDLSAALRQLRKAGSGRWRAEVERLRGAIPATSGSGDEAIVVALAQPERLARRRSQDSTTYLMASGTAVELPGDSPLRGNEWIAVAIADRNPGRSTGIVRLAAAVDEQLARRAAPALLSETDEIAWSDGDVRANRTERLGAIELAGRPLLDPDPARIRSALLDGLRTAGLDLLNWDDDARRLRQRIGFLHHALGGDWPATDEESLIEAAELWLEPELSQARNRADLRQDAGRLLRRLIPWSAAARFDELAPDRIEVPTGSRIRVDYSGAEPALPVKLQEVFGWTRAPRIADGRVPVVLHLLSPAGRPAAVTGDLESFWRNGYPQVRAELRGRYPKHPWPEDPTTATPTRHTNRRR